MIQCGCENGKGFQGTECPGFKQHKCESCKSGYGLDDQHKCVPCKSGFVENHGNTNAARVMD